MPSRFRAYIKPFDDLGVYQDWIEVTDDVVWEAVGNLDLSLDNTEYDIGVFRNSSISVTLQNQKGFYSDIDQTQSIFKYKRSDSQFKLTWQVGIDSFYTGIGTTDEGNLLSESVDVFVGLLNDDSAKLNLEDQKISFSVLGREGLFDQAIVPIASISIGDLMSAVLLDLLDQSTITDLLTVSAGNISLGSNQTLDAVDYLENKTVKEALDDLLKVSNSVLYIQDDSVIIAPRTPTAEVMFEFFGQAATNGAENIVKIEGIRTGVARVFNFIRWQDTALYSENSTSTAKYGKRIRDFSSDAFTDTTKRQNILDAIKAEFGLPKQEFEITVPISYEALDVNLLDRVSVDYPLIAIDQDTLLPIWGSAVAGEAIAPHALYSFQLNPDDHFKVMGKTIQLKEGLIKFRLRGV